MAINEPFVQFNIIPASSILGIGEQRSLLVGQKLASGTATSGVLISGLPSDGSEDTLFGQGSHMAELVRAFKLENRVSPLDIIPIDDPGGGTAATCIVTFGTGPADGVGEFEVSVVSRKYHKYTVEVADADTISIIGDKLVAAVALDDNALFDAVNVGGVVTFTAKNTGVIANGWGIAVSGSVGDVTVAVTGWSGGLGTPVLTGLLDVISNVRYRSIVWPEAYDIDYVKDDLDAKFNTPNILLDGVGIQTKSDTLANLKTYVETINSQSIVVIGQRFIDESDREGPAMFEMPDVIASQVAAIRALRFTEGSNLTPYLTATSSKDQFGGIGIGSLPYFNTLLPNAPVALPPDEFNSEELIELNTNGVANIGPNRVFTNTIMGTMVTTYLKDNAGNTDLSYRYLNTVDTVSLIREFFFVNCKARYAQTRLTNGDLVAGRNVANEASIRAFLGRLYDELADDVLVQKGTAAKQDFNDNLIIEIILLSTSPSIPNGTVRITMAPLLVTQLRALVGTIQVNFGSN